MNEPVRPMLGSPSRRPDPRPTANRVPRPKSDIGRLVDMADRAAVIDWLLDPEHSDPSIRWQVMRDLLDAPQSEWAAERAKVETEGWGARLLAVEDEDGQWAGGAHFPADFDWR